METKDKELLLKDLCARLPYGVVCHYDVIVPMVGKVKSYDRLHAISEFDSKPCFQFMGNRDIFDFDNIKPYLFPMSSMTEEQRKEYNSIIYKEIELHADRYYDVIEVISFEELQDFYHKYHIDYRGFIDKGLAIDATGLNIY